jgi:pimeloyl-ACP methyl ester carboxylesterase
MAAFAMGGAAPPAHAAPELEPCGGGALCGSISVPLDRTGATPGRIRIHFELYRRTDRTRARLGTLMAAEGGPGYSTTDSRDYYLELFGPLRKRHDVLLIDQRGTGLSGAIKCPLVQRYIGDSVKNAEVCGASLGDRSDLYTTANATADTATVLDALAIPRVSLYGDSYGSFFAQAFTVNHPDRVRQPRPRRHLSRHWHQPVVPLHRALDPPCPRDRLRPQRRNVPGCAERDAGPARTAARTRARRTDRRQGAGWLWRRSPCGDHTRHADLDAARGRRRAGGVP